ncbi:MAG: potassium channel family protein [Acidobacteriia bacterium]|nr:potassium channel family protein [Terriglobia bacterium]
MDVAAAIAGVLVVAGVLLEAFETVVLPRRVTRRFRLTRGFYRYTWRPWAAVARHIRRLRRRESFLALYGPMSLILLLALWAVGLVLGFALLQWAAGSTVEGGGNSRTFATDLYFSGTTLFTLGLGDVTPRAAISRVLTVIESGMGLGFLALVLSYLPVVYQSFSRREVNVSLLDGRAGTPPTAAELVRRNIDPQDGNLREILHEWEHSAAEMLESHISYPVLGYFRSQHDNQSWVAALTAVLDASALCQSIDGAPARQAQLTFAMARHAIVDLAQVFNTPPRDPPQPRLTPESLQQLRQQLAEGGIQLLATADAEQRLAKLRSMYEPYIAALAEYFLVQLPPWFRPPEAHDNWRTSRWGGQHTI